MEKKFRGLALAACALLLSSTALASSVSQNYPLRITVLRIDSQGAAIQQAPTDCNFQTYSAYCNGSQNTAPESVMLVKGSDGSTFSIVCPSEWAGLGQNCTALPVGSTYDARLDNRRLTVVYVTSKGKQKKQVFVLTKESAIPEEGSSVGTNGSGTADAGMAPAPVARAATAPAPVIVPSQEKVRCNFTSTPSGAEISIDGNYAGSTPSVLPLTVGEHAVVVTLPGYADWSRNLNVLAGSELTVTSNLQKK